VLLPIKVTIVPEVKVLELLGTFLKKLNSVHVDQMLDEMCIATMGGRAAEKVTFNRISTGALVI
jgi:cell division protease FtsH